MSLKDMPARTLLTRLIIALSAFAIGVLPTVELVHDLRHAEVRPRTETAPIVVSACDLSEPTGKYVGKLVLVRATVYHVLWSNEVGPEDFLYVHPRIDEICEGADPLIVTQLDLNDYVGPNADLRKLLGPFVREVDVEIVVVVTLREHRFSEARYGIKPESLNVVSARREFTPKGAA